jgi:phosphoribosylanthranilate isomerase
MARPVIKFCGFTQAADIDAAVDLGVELIGLNLAKGPRRIDLERAAELAKRVPPGVGVVALFVDAPVDVVRRSSDLLRTDTVQLHGDESPEIDETLMRDLRVIRAIRVASADDLQRALQTPGDVLLLDAGVSGQHGGTGHCWDHELLTGWNPGRPWMLAGGLTPANAAAATRHGAWGLDTASGVECAPGRKDRALMEAFVQAVRSA